MMGMTVAQIEKTIKSKTEPDRFTPLSSSYKCPVCQKPTVQYESDYPSEVEPFASQKVLYCIDCGSGFVAGSATLLDTYYKVDYATLNRRDREASPEKYFSPEFRDASRKIGRYFRRSARQVETLKRFGVTFNDILDYGSGPGYFLYASNATKKYAFEPDRKSAKYLKYLGARQLLKVCEISRFTYDGIVASHSLEHLVPEELDAILRILLNSLKPDGKLLIEVPHGGHSYLHLDARQDPHTIFFTPEGICRAVEIAGGQILYCAAAAKTVAPLRETPIYVPSAHPFYSERRGSIVVVCTLARCTDGALGQKRSFWRWLFG